LSCEELKKLTIAGISHRCYVDILPKKRDFRKKSRNIEISGFAYKRNDKNWSKLIFKKKIGHKFPILDTSTSIGRHQ
jgi:hypothetical protein